MFYDYFVFREKETNEIQLVVEKELLNTKIHEIVENFDNWSWETVKKEDIDKI